MPRCFVSIGSNIEKEINIPSSLRALDRYFGPLIVSNIYESKPVGFDGENFYNLVVGFDSDLNVHKISEILKQIEMLHGRTRNCKKFSARTLDLDLLLYGNLIISEQNLQIPRHEIESYAFVLEPLAEIAPELVHPVSSKTIIELWDAFDKSDLAQKQIPSA